MKFKKRLLIDVVTGVTLCGIFVAAGYAILSPNFTSFSTPTSEAILCGTNDCGTNPGTVDAGGSCGCNPGMVMGSPPNETCMPPMMDQQKCMLGMSCTDPGAGSDYTCIDLCPPGAPLCTDVMAMHPGHNEPCSVLCKTPGTNTCTSVQGPTGTCAVENDVCIPGDYPDNEMKCRDPCEEYIDSGMPKCDDPDFMSPVETGGDCVGECYTRNSSGNFCSTTSNFPLMCDQTDGPRICDSAGTGTCVDPCASFPGGMCEDIDLTPVGEGEFCMLTCNEYNGTTCNSNGSRSIPCNSPSLMCNPTSRLCEPMCNGMPGSCSSSSSSSSSAPMCCNLTTQTCEPI